MRWTTVRIGLLVLGSAIAWVMEQRRMSGGGVMDSESRVGDLLVTKQLFPSIEALERDRRVLVAPYKIWAPMMIRITPADLEQLYHGGVLGIFLNDGKRVVAVMVE